MNQLACYEGKGKRTHREILLALIGLYEAVDLCELEVRMRAKQPRRTHALREGRAEAAQLSAVRYDRIGKTAYVSVQEQRTSSTKLGPGQRGW